MLAIAEATSFVTEWSRRWRPAPGVVARRRPAVTCCRPSGHARAPNGIDAGGPGVVALRSDGTHPEQLYIRRRPTPVQPSLRLNGAEFMQDVVPLGPSGVGPAEPGTGRSPALTRLLSYLPRGNTLDDKAWQRRHRLLQIVLLL